MKKIIAEIPVRLGGQRVPKKNLRLILWKTNGGLCGRCLQAVESIEPETDFRIAEMALQSRSSTAGSATYYGDL